VAASEQEQGAESGRILRFRPRLSGRPKKRGALGSGPPVDDLQKYEGAGEPDDYWHRMKVNAIAFVFIAMLTLVGLWLAEEMALLRTKQDCAFAGRRTCPELDLQTRQRGSGPGTADHRQSDRGQAPPQTNPSGGGG
jgi:hypothetical protein